MRNSEKFLVAFAGQFSKIDGRRIARAQPAATDVFGAWGEQ